MPHYLVSYTLRRPGQNYSAVRSIIDGISFRYAKADESLYRISSPYSAYAIKHMLIPALDLNDELRIYTITAEDAFNSELVWYTGAQSFGDRARADVKLRELARTGLAISAARRRAKASTSGSWR